MAKLPAIQIYVGDWMRDVGGCSMQAQGLWLRMIFVMHDADVYGELSVNNEPLPDSYIANKCGLSLRKYRVILKELDTYNVLSYAKNGSIMSGRMKRDHAKRLKTKGRVEKHRGDCNASVTHDVTHDVTPLKRRSSSSSSSSSSISFKKELNAAPLNKEADKELREWVREFEKVFGTKHIPNKDRWEQGAMRAIDSGVAKSDYIETLGELTSDPTRKFPVTPDNVLTTILQSRIKPTKETYEQRINRLADEERAAALSGDGNPDIEAVAEYGESARAH